jgi:hypothetical protein
MSAPTAPAPVPTPTVADVRAWLNVTTEQVTDEDLTVIRDAEVSNQLDECRVPTDLQAAGLLPPPLAAAVYRRCARAVAARNLPLGYRAGDDEFGPMRLSSWDAEITRLEGTKRKFVFG